MTMKPPTFSRIAGGLAACAVILWLVAIVLAFAASMAGAQAPTARDTAHVLNQRKGLDSTRVALDSLRRWCRVPSYTTPKYLRKVCEIAKASPDMRAILREDSLLLASSAPPTSVTVTITATRDTIYQRPQPHYTEIMVRVRNVAGAIVADSVPISLSDPAALAVAPIWVGAGNATCPRCWHLKDAVKSGTLTVTATYQGVTASKNLTLIGPTAPIPPPDTSTPPVPPSGPDIVVQPFPQEFILGPQLKWGVAPIARIDSAQLARARQLCASYPAVPAAGRDDYYDYKLAMRALYARSQQADILTCARMAEDRTWQAFTGNGTFAVQDCCAPRNLGFGGFVLRALDGHPEMWSWLTRWADYHYWIWLGRHVNDPQLHEGIRDGGYMLLHVTQLAAVHPDPAIRARMLDSALTSALKYWYRLQRPDGTWRWTYSDSPNVPYTQPFQVGIPVRGLTDLHRLLTALDSVKWKPQRDSLQLLITRAADGWWMTYRNQTPGTTLFRAAWYLYGGVFAQGSCEPPLTEAKAASNCAGVSVPITASSYYEARQINALNVSLFGYAYRLTGNLTYIAHGDELLHSMWSNADGYMSCWWCAQDAQKLYSQHFADGGRYLVWRR